MQRKAIKRLTMLSLVSLFTLFTAVASANAQLSNPIRAKIPFDFSMGDKKLPAGEYTFRRLSEFSSDKTMLVSNVDSNTRVFQLTFGARVLTPEFQHSHEIAKLVGSPPGYLGHRETHPLLSQENLDRYHTEETKLSFVLFDEIEKASDALWQLLLGILDKATLTLGDNQNVDFSRTVIVMTSNLGAREISELISGGIGFAPAYFSLNTGETEVEQKIYHTALEAARRKFSPEFMNRIDKVVVYRPLKQYHLQQIVDLELRAVQDRIMHSVGAKFVLQCSDAAKDMLLREGLDFRYGARHVKRSIERFLVYPLSSLIATEQVRSGDVVYVDIGDKKSKLVFMKYSVTHRSTAGLSQPLKRRQKETLARV